MPTVEQARAWYGTSDPVHGIDHVLRVLRVAEELAREAGADLEIVRAAALLHDARGAAPEAEGEHDGSGTSRRKHELASAEFAESLLLQEGWMPDRIEAVLHCIRAHRYRGEEAPETLEAQVLFDADKLDVLGAFGISRTLGYAQQAGQPAFEAPSERFLESGQREPDEAHSAYHEYLFKLRKVGNRLHTQPAREIAAQREPLLHAFFQQMALEAGWQGPG